jgi:hypothetical protein
MADELERIFKEALLASSRFSSVICLEGSEENHGKPLSGVQAEITTEIFCEYEFITLPLRQSDLYDVYITKDRACNLKSTLRSSNRHTCVQTLDRKPDILA